MTVKLKSNRKILVSLESNSSPFSVGFILSVQTKLLNLFMQLHDRHR